jgi:threonine aldolase
MLGGGMRQAGVLAAAGIYALEHMVERLADDHDNARTVAEALSGIPGLTLDPPPQTNLIFFRVEGWEPAALVQRLGEVGVLCFDEGGRIRWATHFGIERNDVIEAVARLRSVVARGS